MTISEKISLNEARFLAITCQALINTYISKSSQSQINSLLKIIEQIGYVQIDTISIIERSHHHVLWARMPEYKRHQLNDLVDKKLIFEYWSHAASFLPMNKFRYSLVRKKNYSDRHKDWAKTNKKILNYVYDRIKNEGPLQSRNFEDSKRTSKGWGDSKPSKEALEFLFHTGKLMVVKRLGFQKVYDISERVIPEGGDMNLPSEREYYEHLIYSSINSNGFAAENEITYLRKYDKKIFENTINELLENKNITKVNINEIRDKDYFTSEENLSALNKRNGLKDMHILSPFDNLLIQRRRVKTLFNFDYQLECYLPDAKRKFGYFCLPVLYADKFIGKIDAKADRIKNLFTINKFYIENGVVLNKNMKQRLVKKLSQLSHFTGCDKMPELNI